MSPASRICGKTREEKPIFLREPGGAGGGQREGTRPELPAAARGRQTTAPPPPPPRPDVTSSRGATSGASGGGGGGRGQR